MSGSNAGTGRPLWFRCSNCRLRWDWVSWERKGYAGRVVLTGKKRACPPGRAGSRNSTHKRQYLCLDCRHVGWSRHSCLEEKEQCEGIVAT